jgi:hypothetical protein
MWMIIIGAVAVGGNACTVKADDSERFRDPIPQAGDVATGVPGTAASAVKAQAAPGLRLTDLPVGNPAYARYYQLTRDYVDVVDEATAWVLALVDLIVHQPATTVELHKAAWGPWHGDALSPVVWRFTVIEVGDREYTYTLEGRPKASTSETDFRTVLAGHGWGKARPEHRQGNFTLDFTASHALDPARSKDDGVAKLTYDLRQFPATINVDLTSSDQTRHGDVLVTHEADTSGAVDITSHDDVDPSKTTKLEDITLHSRWDRTGAGRADVRVSGGDLPANIPSVAAAECWNSAFARVYYQDSVNSEPPAGNAAACAFSAVKP